MIEKKINNLKNTFENVHMSSDDKRDVFKRVSLVVDKIEAVSSEFHRAPILSPFANNESSFSGGRLGSRFASNIFVYIRQRKFVPSLVIVLLLCVTGGVSALAEDALPGDSLYSLKVNINEQVKGFVAVTPEAKARLAVETTERRLQEAVILSSQGKLTDENKQIIQGQLNKSANDVKNNVASLVASNDISTAQEVSINFEASLKTHELMLETLTKKENDLNNNASTTATAATAATAVVTDNKTDNASSTKPDTFIESNASTSQSTTTPEVSVVNVAHPIDTLMQDIRQEIKYNAQVRENLSQKEIFEGTDSTKIIDKITNVKVKYVNLNYQRKTLTDLSTASIKLFDTYLGTASTTIKEAEIALQNNDLTKAVTSLQQATKAMSDSDSLLSIELNSKPEVRRALELIDINKLLDSIHSDDSNSIFNSTSTVSLAPTNSTSTGVVLGTSTSPSESLGVK